MVVCGMELRRENHRLYEIFVRNRKERSSEIVKFLGSLEGLVESDYEILR